MMSVGSVPEGLRGDPNAQLVWFGPAPFKAIGIIAFAFVCHHSTFLIFDSLEIPTLDRFTRVTHYATAISLVFSILLAYLGYFTFVQKTAGNVLNNFPTDNNVINVARFCFALNMLTTFPIECYVACHVLQDYFQIYNRALWAILLVFLSIFIACFVPDVSLILEITGSFSASALAFILPPLLWLKLSNSLKWPCMVCIGFGIVVLIFSLIF
ncbi:hypothetical protein HMI54_007331 [Coelomomyces lativittatus]|nr:hypothetical protein HMI54_007331 [Coelomomyces lativittatus]